MRLPDNWKKAPLTAGLAIVTIAAGVIAAVFQQEDWAIITLGFWPSSFEAGPVPVWLEPLTATLVHAGIGHLFFNMIVLVFCGRPVESVLGTPAMAVLYLLGAYAVLFGRNKVKVANPTLALWLNALWLMAAWVVLQICLGIALSGAIFVTGGQGVTIAVAAHIGGFLVGLVLANPLLLFKYRRA